MAKVLSILFVVAMGFSMGCGGDTIGELESLKTEMCECKDADCATKVMETLKSKKETMSKPSGEDEEKAKKLLVEMMTCGAKVGMKLKL